MWYNKFWFLLNSLFVAVLLFVGSIFLLGCNITYKVRNQHNDIELINHFPCGKVAFELVGKGNSKFKFKQKFDIENSITLLTDSLKVYYNDVEVSKKFDNKNLFESELEISREAALEVSFELEKGVFDGDTILIFANEYIRCNDKSISLDTIIYSFVNNLRIQGVNDLN